MGHGFGDTGLMDKPFGVWDLACADARLRQIALLGAIFVVAPLAFALRAGSGGFLTRYLDSLLTAFSWPLALLLALAVYRLFRLDQLAERGQRFRGVVQRIRRGRAEPERGEVRFATPSGPHTVTVFIPAARAIGEGSTVELLVDYPARPRNAVIVG